MAKITFKEYQQGQETLFPSRLDENIPEDAPVRLINQIVDQLDISKIMSTYLGGGTSSYSPRMMLKVLFYAYMNNVYSCRKIAALMEQNIHYMWLSGKQFPKYNTINNFRSLHLKDHINELFTEVVIMLVNLNYISLKEQYIDGTKIESKANRYTFVWKKSVEKNKEKLEAKIRNILEQIDEGIAQDNQPDDEPPTPIDSQSLKEKIAAINKNLLNKQQVKQVKDIEDKYLPKLKEYEDTLSICGKRNSYSKTDHDSTFMRMKEDAMNNGQTKPGYNLQIATENQFITNFGLFSNPTDTNTLKPLLETYEQRYGFLPEKLIADAGYGSEENYNFMEENQIEAFVKYNYFHKEQKKSFKENPFLPENLFYNKKDNYYVCPMGQHMNHQLSYIRINESGYESTIDVYVATNCKGCPLRGMCHKSKDNRKIEINHALNEYKKKARERLMSEEGLKHRRRRPIEPEAVFGQMKYNKLYKRFRHVGKENVLMDFTIFAIAFNMQKMWKIISQNNSLLQNLFKTIILSRKTMLFLQNIASLHFEKTKKSFFDFQSFKLAA